MSATAQLRAAATRTANAAPEFESLLQRSVRSTFDPAAWHAMNERDSQLIRDQILHGHASKDFVYSFDIKGKAVTGVSVVGARELASQYGGIKARIVATVEKRGSLFVFRTFQPLTIETRHLPDLSTDDDFYECVMEVEDIKTGNSLQVRKKETRMESRRDGSQYERPHYDVIAEAKAFRNAVLSVLPQNVVIDFEARCLKAGTVSKEKTIDQLREGVLKFAASKQITVDRQAVMQMTFAQIDGLREAAGEGVDVFKGALLALGVVAGQDAQAKDVPATGGERTTTPAAKTEERTETPAAKAHEEQAGPSVEDAIAAAKRGEDDVARDLANSIGGEAPDRVAAIIAQREAQQAQPPAEQRGARRARANISTE